MRPAATAGFRLGPWAAAGVLTLVSLSVAAQDAQPAAGPSVQGVPGVPAAPALQGPTGVSTELPSLRATSPADPFEPFNRSVFGFNDFIDRTTIKPLAEGYRRWVPELARTGVENFFGNFSDVWSAVNQLLQGACGSPLWPAPRAERHAAGELLGRRRGERRAHQAVVLLRLPGQAGDRHAQLRDLSLGGLSLLAGQRVPHGSVFGCRRRTSTPWRWWCPAGRCRPATACMPAC